jgi:hypothetical protein
VIGMNEAQVWTAIGVLAAALAGTVTVVTTLFLRVIRTEFAVVHIKLDHVGRDVNALIWDRFGLDRGEA